MRNEIVEHGQRLEPSREQGTRHATDFDAKILSRLYWQWYAELGLIHE